MWLRILLVLLVSAISGNILGRMLFLRAFHYSPLKAGIYLVFGIGLAITALNQAWKLSHGAGLTAAIVFILTFSISAVRLHKSN